MSYFSVSSDDGRTIHFESMELSQAQTHATAVYKSSAVICEIHDVSREAVDWRKSSRTAPFAAEEEPEEAP